MRRYGKVGGVGRVGNCIATLEASLCHRYYRLVLTPSTVLKVEYAEKQAILRDYQRTEDVHTELKIRFEELQKEKEEVTMDLSNAKEELRQEQTDLKNARREAENTKKQIWNEKNLREKVEQELNDKAEKCRAYKNNLQELQKSLTKLQNENVALEDKVISLDNDR